MDANPNQSQNPMSFADALNLSKQVILKQSDRIKLDQTKLSQFQDQNRVLYEQVGQLEQQLQGEQSRAHDLSVDLDGKSNRVKVLEGEMVGMQQSLAALQKLADEQKAEVVRLQLDVENLLKRVPTEADEKALQELAALLTRAEQVAKQAIPLSQAA